MALKYEIILKDNPDYSIDKIKLLQRLIARLRGVNDIQIEADEDTHDDDMDVLDRTINEINNTIKAYRKDLKNALDEPKVYKRLRITSDKVWSIFEETIDGETGRTKYLDPATIKIDRTIDYNHKLNLPAIVKEAQDEAYVTLREMRGQRKTVSVFNKTYFNEKFAHLEIHPVYQTVAGGGITNACTKTYKDAWRDYGEYTYTVPSTGFTNQMFPKLAQDNNHCNVHLKGGTFLELKESGKAYRALEPKKPTTTANHVGVEIEFISKLGEFQIAQALAKEDVQEFVHLHQDNSLRKEDGYPYRHEIAIVAPERMILLVVEKVLKAINKDKASKVNWRCGLHVHIDVRNRNKELVFHNFIKSQRIMFAMNPRSRQDGTMENGRKDEVYSRRLSMADWEEAIEDCKEYAIKMKKIHNNGIDYSRYAGVNPMAFEKHKTIEIRIHSGSINFEKISNWITILLAVANLDTKLELEPAKPETFCKHVGLNKKIVEYIKERVEKFKDKDGQHCTVDEVA